MTICKVCGSSGADFHFGGHCCRACAAFFRRFVVSRKRSIVCNCSERRTSSYPCRHCRMLKCLAVGLDRKKVQPPREKNKEGEMLSLDKPSTSLLNGRVIGRSCFTIMKTVSIWDKVDSERMQLYRKGVQKVNFYEISCCASKDAELMWKMAEYLFPDMSSLKASDKDALLCNFMPKLFIVQAPFKFWWFEDCRNYLEETEEMVSAISEFYEEAIPEEHRMSKKDIFNVFKPYWNFYYGKVVLPIEDRENDKVESLGQLLLLLLDPAYMNISEECEKHVRALRTIVLRELKSYNGEQNHPESRFFHALEDMVLIEKGVQKIQEELHLCDLYKVRLHEDFRRIVMDTNRL